MRARTLTRLFPREWRERYGDEYAALLEARPITAHDVGSTAALVTREWLKTGWAVVPIACVMSEGAVLGGRALSRFGAPPVWAAVTAAMALVLLCGYDLWRGVARWPAVIRTGHMPEAPPVSDRRVRHVLAAVFVAGLIYEWRRAVSGARSWPGLELHGAEFLLSIVFMVSLSVQAWSVSAATRRRRCEQRMQDRIRAAGQSASTRPIGLQ